MPHKRRKGFCKKGTMKWLLLIICTLSCLLLFASCSTDTQVKTTFTKEELLSDYDQCWAILEENYPFLPVLEAHGIDLQGVKDSYRQTLAERVTDLDGFYVLLRQMFYSLENFAHLGVVDPGTYQIYAQSGMEPDTTLCRDPQTAAAYAALSDVVAGSVESPTPDVETFYDPELKAAYFHFRTFNYPYEGDSAVGAYLAHLEEAGSPVEHVIIDITGNSGGNSDIVAKDIIAPLGGGTWNYTLYFADSAINRAWLFPEYEDIQELTGAPAEPDFTKELGMTHYLEHTVDFPSAQKTYAENAHRWLLIDERCYSASESLIGFCKDTGWATIVGRRGQGDGDFLSSFRMSLEHTGLLIQFSTTTRANADGSLNAEKGEAPDYLCKPGESPLRKCMELIQEEENGDT